MASVNVPFAPSRTFSFSVCDEVVYALALMQRENCPEKTSTLLRGHFKLKRVEAERVVLSWLSFDTSLGVVSVFCTFVLFVKRLEYSYYVAAFCSVSIDFK